MEPPKTYLNQQRDGLFYWFLKKKFFLVLIENLS